MEDADDGAVCLPVDDGDAGHHRRSAAIAAPAAHRRRAANRPSRARRASAATSAHVRARGLARACASHRHRRRSWCRCRRARRRRSHRSRRSVRKYDSLLHALAIGGSRSTARDERLLSGRAFFGTGELPPPPKHYFAPPSRRAPTRSRRSSATASAACSGFRGQVSAHTRTARPSGAAPPAAPSVPQIRRAPPKVAPHRHPRRLELHHRRAALLHHRRRRLRLRSRVVGLPLRVGLRDALPFSHALLSGELRLCRLEEHLCRLPLLRAQPPFIGGEVTRRLRRRRGTRDTLTWVNNLAGLLYEQGKVRRPSRCTTRRSRAAASCPGRGTRTR